MPMPKKSLTFAERVYEKLREVPAGKVTTYKALAQALHTRAYQAIGQALKKNPYAPVVPCHRVVASDGKLGGFMGHRVGETIDRKIAMLTAEGVPIHNGRIQNFSQYLYQFPAQS